MRSTASTARGPHGQVFVRGVELPLRDLVDGVDVVDSLALGAVALMHGIDAKKAGLAVGRGLFAFADLHRRGPGLFKAAQAVARARGGLGGDLADADIAANQPRGLRPAEPRHALHVGPQQPFGPPLLERVFVMAEQALHPAVNLRAAATFKPHTVRGRKKCLDLNQAQLLCTKHADHPSSACPLRLLQAHLALESTPGFRLILRWTRVKQSPSSIWCYTDFGGSAERLSLPGTVSTALPSLYFCAYSVP